MKPMAPMPSARPIPEINGIIFSDAEDSFISPAAFIIGAMAKAAATAIIIPIMNIMPPIVGMPCFFLCHLGPISRIVCPYLSFLNIGITIFPESAVATNAISAAATGIMPSIFSTSPF